jgi:hypothetical protein
VLYNPLGQARNDTVQLPVSGNGAIYGPKVNISPNHCCRLTTEGELIANSYSVEDKAIFFTASVPAMGYAVYFLKKGTEVVVAEEITPKDGPGIEVAACSVSYLP